MRSLLYLTVVAALAVGLLCAGTYASLLVTMFLSTIVPRDALPWVYWLALLAFAGWVVYFTARVVASAVRRGPPSAFRGWRYAAAAACVAAFLFNVLALVMPALPSGARGFLGILAYQPLSYVPVVLLAIAALPSPEGS